MNLSREQLATAVRALCADFGHDYWQRADEARAYPHEFVDALTDAGYLACLFPRSTGEWGWGCRSLRDPRGDQPLGRQRGRLPGRCTRWGRCSGTRWARDPRNGVSPGTRSELCPRPSPVTVPGRGSDTGGASHLRRSGAGAYEVKEAEGPSSRGCAVGPHDPAGRNAPIDEWKKRTAGLCRVSSWGGGWERRDADASTGSTPDQP